MHDRCPDYGRRGLLHAEHDGEDAQHDGAKSKRLVMMRAWRPLQRTWID
jgi:hypothetical protein